MPWHCSVSPASADAAAAAESSPDESGLADDEGMSAAPPKAALDAAQSARNHLIARREAGDRHGFVEQASIYLARVADPQIALFLVEALAQLHLGDAATAVLDRLDLTIAGVDIAALRREIARLPKGRVPADARMLEANLSRLSGYPGLNPSSIRTAFDDVECHRCACGAVHVASGKGAWLGPLSTGGLDPAAASALARSNQAAAIVGCIPALVIDEAFRQTIAPAGTRQRPLYVIEPDERRFAAWLSLADRRAIIDAAHVYLFVGPDAWTSLRRLAEARDDLQLPSIALGAEGALAPVKQIVSDVERERERTGRKLARSLRLQHAPRSSSDWARRLEPGAVVVGLTSRHTTMLQYSMRDIRRAFTSHGYDFRIVKERSSHAIHNELTNRRAILEHDPALVLLLNHLRPGDSVGDVPTLTWVQDPTPDILSSRAADKLGQRDFLAGFYAQECIDRYGYPADRYFPLGFFPVCGHMFHPAALAPGEDDRFTCDAAYIGHLHDTPETYVAGWKATRPTEQHVAIDRLCAAIDDARADRRHLLRADVQQLLDEHCPEIAGDVTMAIAGHRYFDLHHRLETLRWAALWAKKSGRSLRLYGRGWEKHPDFAAHAAGEVAHGEEARRAYRGATLSVQTVPSGLIHQRTFEALASGSFVLGRYAPVNFVGLSPGDFRSQYGDGSTCDRAMYPRGLRGLDRIVFDSAETFAERADHYLAAPDERMSVQDELATVVRNRFTYDAVVPDILRFVRRGLMA